MLGHQELRSTFNLISLSSVIQKTPPTKLCVYQCMFAYVSVYVYYMFKTLYVLKDLVMLP